MNRNFAKTLFVVSKLSEFASKTKFGELINKHPTILADVTHLPIDIVDIILTKYIKNYRESMFTHLGIQIKRVVGSHWHFRPRSEPIDVHINVREKHFGEIVNFNYCQWSNAIEIELFLHSTENYTWNKIIINNLSLKVTHQKNGRTICGIYYTFTTNLPVIQYNCPIIEAGTRTFYEQFDLNEIRKYLIFESNTTRVMLGNIGASIKIDEHDSIALNVLAHNGFLFDRYIRW